MPIVRSMTCVTGCRDPSPRQRPGNVQSNASASVDAAELLKILFAGIDEILKLVLELVGQTAHVAPLLGGNIPKIIHDLGHQSVAAEILDAHRLQRGRVDRRLRLCQRGLLQNGKFLNIHVFQSLEKFVWILPRSGKSKSPRHVCHAANFVE